MFKQDRNKTQLGQLANEGYKDWKNLAHRLASHETSNEHISCMIRWIELEKRLQKNKIIDEGQQEQNNREREHWRQVLLRIIVVAKRLSKNSLAFRGQSEKIYEENNEFFFTNDRNNC